MNSFVLFHLEVEIATSLKKEEYIRARIITVHERGYIVEVFETGEMLEISREYIKGVYIPYV